MQRGDFPPRRHSTDTPGPARQQLVHVVKQLRKRAGMGHITRFIKACAHRGEPLIELADSLAAEVAESDPARSIALDQDPEAVYVLLKETWVDWDARVREVLVQQAFSDRREGGQVQRLRPPRSLSRYPGCSDLIRVGAHWARYWGR
jgi:hypothetical protein